MCVHSLSARKQENEQLHRTQTLELNEIAKVTTKTQQQAIKIIKK